MFLSHLCDAFLCLLTFYNHHQLSINNVLWASLAKWSFNNCHTDVKDLPSNSIVNNDIIYALESIPAELLDLKSQFTLCKTFLHDLLCNIILFKSNWLGFLLSVLIAVATTRIHVAYLRMGFLAVKFMWCRPFQMLTQFWIFWRYQ